MSLTGRFGTSPLLELLDDISSTKVESIWEEVDATNGAIPSWYYLVIDIAVSHEGEDFNPSTLRQDFHLYLNATVSCHLNINIA